MDADPSVPLRLWKSDLATTRAHLKKARLNQHSAHRRDAVTERVDAAVAASGRPKLMKLLRKLGPCTALVVWKPDALGRDATDILKTIRTVKACGAEVYCMDLNYDDVTHNKDVMNTLKAMSALEQMTGKTRALADALGRGVAGGRIGRPPSLDDATKAKVCACLEAGETVSTVARRFHTSRQTVLRVRDAKR